MKKIFILLATFILIFALKNGFSQCNDNLLNVCMPNIGPNKFLKSYPVRLQASKQGAPMEQVKYNITLNSGVTYKILACNASEFPGKVIINLNQGMRLIATTYDEATKKHYPSLTYQCKMSGLYSLTFYFEDGKEGCAVGILSQQN